MPQLPGDGMMTDVGEEEQIAMPVMQPLAKVDARTMQRIDERGFHADALRRSPRAGCNKGAVAHSIIQ